MLESAVTEVGDSAGGEPDAVWEGGGGYRQGRRSQREPGGGECELRCHSESRGAGGGFADLFPNPRREAA